MDLQHLFQKLYTCTTIAIKYHRIQKEIIYIIHKHSDVLLERPYSGPRKVAFIGGQSKTQNPIILKKRLFGTKGSLNNVS